ncbi:hypothetical protein B0H16DRAFT_1696778 [Mycena metata]|uniref:Uncharacterized protein n=1 Tax=Mycena metata TaxID=1033252 RepID=A0AAD7HY33_9AGAR|nr:hypothetical protein B0H16DRAFT_1696778 [Mycena metata]
MPAVRQRFYTLELKLPLKIRFESALSVRGSVQALEDANTEPEPGVRFEHRPNFEPEHRVQFGSVQDPEIGGASQRAGEYVVTRKPEMRLRVVSYHTPVSRCYWDPIAVEAVCDSPFSKFWGSHGAGAQGRHRFYPITIEAIFQVWGSTAESTRRADHWVHTLGKSDTSAQTGLASQQTRHNFRKPDMHSRLISRAFARINGLAPRPKYLPLSSVPPPSPRPLALPRLFPAPECAAMPADYSPDEQQHTATTKTHVGEVVSSIQGLQNTPSEYDGEPQFFVLQVATVSRRHAAVPESRRSR